MMFAYLGEYAVILVTGCQRSGTTICARMIAHDTGLTYVDEDDYGTTDREAWGQLVGRAGGCVIHCPAMARYVTDFGDCDDVVIVWVDRRLADVVASEQRIGWNRGKAVGKERDKYADVPGYSKDLPICQIKRRYWAQYQKPAIRHWLEVKYTDLQRHPLWVDDRADFGPRQWNRGKA